MPASHSLETVFVRFNPFLMGDIFTGYLGTLRDVHRCAARLRQAAT